MLVLPNALEALIAWKDSKSFVHIKDEAKFIQKVTSLYNGGRAQVHIISDFDMTLTRYWLNGVRSPSSHAIIERSKLLPETIRMDLHQLYQKYYPMEISHDLSYDDKFKAMEEWWTKAHDLIVAAKLSRDTLKEMLNETKVAFRDGIHEFVSLCDAKEIPLLVFSAGIADLIEAIMEQANLNTPNTTVVSNRMIFENDVCVGFKTPHIHVFNKNEAAVSDSIHHEKIDGRPHVILMGDSLGDLHMGADVEYETQLSIGWLNHDQDKLLPQYLDAYDIVFTDDASLEWVTLLIAAIE